MEFSGSEKNSVDSKVRSEQELVNESSSSFLEKAIARTKRNPNRNTTRQLARAPAKRIRLQQLFAKIMCFFCVWICCGCCFCCWQKRKQTNQTQKIDPKLLQKRTSRFALTTVNFVEKIIPIFYFFYIFQSVVYHNLTAQCQSLSDRAQAPNL